MICPTYKHPCAFADYVGTDCDDIACNRATCVCDEPPEDADTQPTGYAHAVQMAQIFTARAHLLAVEAGDNFTTRMLRCACDVLAAVPGEVRR